MKNLLQGGGEPSDEMLQAAEEHFEAYDAAMSTAAVLRERVLLTHGI